MWKFVYILVNIAFLFMWICVYNHVKMRFYSHEYRVKIRLYSCQYCVLIHVNMCLYSREDASIFTWKSCENALFMWKCVLFVWKSCENSFIFLSILRFYSCEYVFTFTWRFVYIHVKIVWKCFNIHVKMRFISVKIRLYSCQYCVFIHVKMCLYSRENAFIITRQ